MFHSKKITFGRAQLGVCSYLWISLLPLVVCVQGYMFGPGGVNYLTNIYALLTLLFFSVFLVSYKVPVYFYYAISLFLALSLITALRGVYLDMVPVRDYFLIIRSWVLFVVVYYFIGHYVKFDKKIKYTRRLFFVFWMFVSVSVILSKYFHVGLYTYPIYSSGFKFWFPATNELSFLFFTSFIVLYYLNDSVTLKMILFAVTVYVFMVIGTKIFIVFFAVLIFLNLLFYFKNKYSVAIASCFLLASLFLIGVILINFEVIAILLSEVLVKYSEGAGKIDVKIQSIGVVSTILGERDFLMKMAASYISEYFSMSDILFGKTVTMFLAEFSAYRGVDDFGMVENDVVDLLASYGIFFVIAYIVFIYKVSNSHKLFARGKLYNGDKITITQGWMMLIAGVLSGHVLFFTLPMLISAVIFGALRSRQ